MGNVTQLYSLRPKLSTMSCFMKQKCQLQIGVTQNSNAEGAETLLAKVKM